jgi:hypothetical protein
MILLQPKLFGDWDVSLKWIASGLLTIRRQSFLAPAAGVIGVRDGHVTVPRREGRVDLSDRLCGVSAASGSSGKMGASPAPTRVLTTHSAARYADRRRCARILHQPHTDSFRLEYAARKEPPPKWFTPCFSPC